MKNVFELKQQFINECNTLEKLVQEGKELLQNKQELQKRLVELFQQTNKSLMTNVSVNFSNPDKIVHDYDDFQCETQYKSIKQHMELFKKKNEEYSPFNVLSVYKRFYREYKRVNNQDIALQINRHLVKVSLVFIKLAKNHDLYIEELLEDPKKVRYDLVKYAKEQNMDIEELIAESVNVFTELINFEPLFISVMPYIFSVFNVLDNKVKKHDILNFLSLDKSCGTLKKINKYPDYITFEEFYKMIIDGIESDKEAYVYDCIANMDEKMLNEEDEGQNSLNFE